MPVSLVVITANSLFPCLVTGLLHAASAPGGRDWVTLTLPIHTGQPGLSSRPEHLSPSATGARPLKGRLRSSSLS